MTKEIYSTGIYKIVTDYAKKYANDQEFKKFLEKHDSPVSILMEFYQLMINQNEFESIEKYEGKADLWNEVVDMNCSREKKIRIAKSIYSLKMILK